VNLSTEISPKFSKDKITNIPPPLRVGIPSFHGIRLPRP
jgi:hypothetical protein